MSYWGLILLGSRRRLLIYFYGLLIPLATGNPGTTVSYAVQRALKNDVGDMCIDCVEWHGWDR